MLWKKLIICVHVLVNKESDIIVVLFVFYLRYYELWQSMMSWTQTHLKIIFSSGYQLKFHCTSPGKVGDVERSNIRSVRHLEIYAGNETTYVMI